MMQNGVPRRIGKVLSNAQRHLLRKRVEFSIVVELKTRWRRCAIRPIFERNLFVSVNTAREVHVMRILKRIAVVLSRRKGGGRRNRGLVFSL
jgi:hypothetical protein